MERHEIIQRIMYLTLLLVFIGVGIAIYVAAIFGHKLNNTSKSNARILQNQKQELDTLSASVTSLKNDNAQQTEYIKCLLVAHNLGNFNISACKEPGQPLPSSTPAPTPTASQATPSSASAGVAHPTPTPVTRQIRDGIGNTISGILKAVGL